MTEDHARLAAVIEGEWARFVATLETAEVWDVPTRLAGWRVEDLARHVHWGVTLEADGLVLAADGKGTARATGRDVTGPRSAVLPALRGAVADLTRALDAVPDGVAVPMPYGDLPLDVALGVFTMEAAVHRSDLTAAVTGDAGLTPAAVPACAATLQTFWPALAQAATTVPPPGTAIVLAGDTVRVAAAWDGAAWTAEVGEPTVVVRGPDEPLLLFALGRLPWSQAGLTATGDRDLAVRFKELVPGP